MKEDWQWPSDDKPFRQGWMTKEDRRRKPATIGKKPGALAKWLLKEPRRSRGALIAVESKLEASKEKWSYGGVKEEIKKLNPKGARCRGLLIRIFGLHFGQFALLFFQVEINV